MSDLVERYACLADEFRAEIERLLSEWADALNEIGRQHQEIERLRADKTELKAEIERLTARNVELQSAFDELFRISPTQATQTMKAEVERLQKIIVRAKDALLDGQSTQWVHDVLVKGLTRDAP